MDIKFIIDRHKEISGSENLNQETAKGANSHAFLTISACIEELLDITKVVNANNMASNPLLDRITYLLKERNNMY